MSGNYYDLDEFLAEEEVIQCRTRFDFSHLSYLDPEASFRISTTTTNHANVLAEGSVIKLPMWAVQRWADLVFCTVMLPIQYRLRSRELIQADPASVSLSTIRHHHHQQGGGGGGVDCNGSSNNYSCFYRSGYCTMNLIQKSCYAFADYLYKTPSSMERSIQLQKIEKNLQDVQQLRETLLQTYTGPRLNQTLDFAISSVGDDVSGFINTLTDLEKRLFYQTSIAATNHQLWKLHGNNYYRSFKLSQYKSSHRQQRSSDKKANTPRTVTPSSDLVDGRQQTGKRIKT